MPEPVAYVWFVDGVPRPIFEDDRGQYVIDHKNTPGHMGGAPQGDNDRPYAMLFIHQSLSAKICGFDS
jgi:hypothetical protein